MDLDRFRSETVAIVKKLPEDDVSKLDLFIKNLKALKRCPIKTCDNMNTK